MKSLVALGLVVTLGACSAEDVPVVLDSIQTSDSYWPADFQQTVDSGQAVDSSQAVDSGPALDVVSVSDMAVVPGDLGSIVPTEVIFADDGDTLYWIDPTTYATHRIGDYNWPSGFGTMTDIAVGSGGNIYGFAWDQLYKIDPASANLTFIATTQHLYNGMSFVDVGGIEKLYAVTRDGAGDSSVYSIELTTGQETKVGVYGTNKVSSGDLIFNPAIGLVGTVTFTSDPDDLLTVDINTGVAKTIGATGFSGVWGLAFWKGKVIGFTNGGKILEINTITGAATVKKTTSIYWYSAGVTPKAPSK